MKVLITVLFSVFFFSAPAPADWLDCSFSGGFYFPHGFCAENDGGCEGVVVSAFVRPYEEREKPELLAKYLEEQMAWKPVGKPRHFIIGFIDGECRLRHLGTYLISPDQNVLETIRAQHRE